MKTIVGLLIAACALSGCATDEHYYKAYTLVELAKAETAKEQATADAKRWDAVKAGLERATPETSAIAAQGIAFAMGSNRQADHAPTILVQPESWFDKGLRLATTLATVGQVAINFKQVTEQGKTARQISSDNVLIEGVRGQTMASVVAAVGKSAGTTTSTSIVAGGDVANNGSTIDKKNCASGQSVGGNGAPGGNGAAGGAGAPGGSGAPGGTGSSTTGNSPGGTAAPGAPGGTGGIGGAGATGGTGGASGSTGGNCK